MKARKFDGKKFDAMIDARNRKEADALRDRLADVVMQNGRLAAEVTHRWLNKYGYYMTPRKEADAEFAREWPEMARKVKAVQDRLKLRKLAAKKGAK